MEEFALGEMRMTFSELYGITPRSLMNKVSGHLKNERSDWERARLLCYYSFSPIDPDDPEKKRMLPLLEFMPLPWDNDSTIKDAWERTKAHANQLKEQNKILWEKVDKNLKNSDVEQ